MAVIGVEIKNQSEFDSGTSWGEFGVYERIDGVVFFGVDPENSANSRIVDLQHAPVGDEGLSLIQLSEPTRLRRISYAVFCLKNKTK